MLIHVLPSCLNLPKAMDRFSLSLCFMPEISDSCPLLIMADAMCSTIILLELTVLFAYT